MNQPSARKFAFLGLILAGLAALAAVVIWAMQGQFNLPLQVALGLVVAGLALFALLDPQRVRQLFTGRQARYGSNALILTLATLGILVVANVLGNQYNQRWDLTADQLRTLAPETVQALQSLPEPVEATAYYTAATPADSARRLLDDLKYQAKGRFDYRFIDPEAEPVAAQNDGITRDGSVILKMGQRKELLTFVTEQSVVSALLRLTNPGERVAYFLTGHGEAALEASGQSSYAEARAGLEAKNYTVRSLNLLAEHTVPSDARVLVIAGPRQPYTDAEIEAIAGFVANGGGLVALLEPDALTDLQGQPDPLLNLLTGQWGIALANDVIIDPGAQQITIAIAAEYGQHAIVNPLNTQQVVTLFPSARTVRPKAGAEDVIVTELVRTSGNAWGETDIAGLQQSQVTRDQDADILGPVSLAVAVQPKEGSGRLVVVGDSDFAADGNFAAYGNGDLLTNAVDWAAGQDTQISITPKTPTQRVLLPPQRATMGLIMLGSIFVLPGLILAAGIVTWVQRRRRG